MRSNNEHVICEQMYSSISEAKAGMKQTIHKYYLAHSRAEENSFVEETYFHWIHFYKTNSVHGADN